MTLEQQAKRNLLRVVDAYQAAQPVTDGVLSKAVYGSSWFVEQLRINAKTKPSDPAGGPSFGLRKYDEMIVWFAENWPVGAAWPADVPYVGKLARIPVTTRGKAKSDGKVQKGKGSEKGKEGGTRRKAA